MNTYLFPLRLLSWALLLGQLIIADASDARAQTPSSDCLDLIVVKNHIWVLTNSGHLKVYDSNGSQVEVKSLKRVTAQLIASNGNDVVAQVGANTQRWNSKDSTWHTIGKLSVNAFALVVNSKQHVFAITNTGVLDVATGETLLPKSSPNNQLTKLAALGKPATYFLDREDNLWLGFGYGEWGGNVFTYDTQHHKFVDLEFNEFQINLHPIKSFFQLKSNVGVSSGLQHMMNSGTIAEFKNLSARTIYTTWNHRDSSTTKQPFVTNSVPYIGPAVYEPETDYIYFYSSVGVFRGKYNSDLSQLASWKKVFEPKLHWRNGQPDAVGSPMNVLKMLSLSNGKLVLLTQNDGIGLWNGDTFKLIP